MEKSQIHIVYLHKEFPFGGAEKVTIDIANELVFRGYEVTILTQVHHEDKYPAHCRKLFHVEILPKGKYKFSFRIAYFLRNYFKQHRVSVFVSYRELLYAKWLKRQTGVAFVFALQSMPFYEMSNASWMSRIFYLNKYWRIYRTADAYGVLCEKHQQRLIQALSLDPHSNKIHVLPNSIEINPAVVWKKEEYVIFVGRLSHRDKRVDRLLRIWAIAQNDIPNWQLKIIGDGPERENLEAQARQIKLQNVCFEGFNTDTQPFFDKAAILCLTSSFEGWPLVLIEAQANAVIPMVFDGFDAAKAIVSSPGEGILVAPFDEQAYARELVALARDTGRRHHMQKAVVAKAATYDIEHTVQAWISLLDHIM